MFNKDQISQMMKQMQTMQEKLHKEMDGVTTELSNLDIQGQAGAGLVTVHINGNSTVKKIIMDPSLFAEDKDMLEDLLVAAVNDAIRKANKIAEEKKSEVSRGMLPTLPAGMKLPF